MKRYKLKKDLPKFKAGEVFEISSKGNLVKRRPCISDCIVAYSAKELKDFPEILRDWFVETQEQPKTVFDLKAGDVCYKISGTIISKCEWKDCEGLISRRSIGDITLTKKEAEEKVAWRKAREILLRDAKWYKPDWSDIHQGKWVVCYDHILKALDVSYNSISQKCHIYFATMSDARTSAKAHPNEWKTYLGVEE